MIVAYDASATAPAVSGPRCTNSAWKILRDVMCACRSGDLELRYAASEMTRRMQDISEDENSPTHSMSVFDLHHAMDGAERVLKVQKKKSHARALMR